mgnify:CR=1 FL=1|tara:strand:- start:7165 stop:7767 length:603 start_codon:yes stop_codon:yes gene_type:complete
MNSFKFKNILALSPHADDVELGCGGTMSKFKDSNIDVISFSWPHDRPDIVNEFKNSMELFKFNYELLDFPVRNLSLHRQDILEILVKKSKQKKYDLVLCPSTYDTHQDHEVICNETFRAFKKTTILGYECPWNCKKFPTDFFIKLDKSHMNDKKKMIDCYKTQGDRTYVIKDYIFDIARTRGLQVDSDFAECFELIRGVI